MLLRRLVLVFALWLAAASAAMEFKKGAFTANTGSGTQDITDVGFQPKLYCLFSVISTAADFSASQNLGVGCTDGTTSRVAHGTGVDNVTTTDVARRWNSTILCEYSAPGGACSRSADHSAFLSNGFRVNWTAAGSALLIQYVAWGGADLTNVKVTEHTFSTGTGNQGYTGVGFRPDFLCLWSANHTAVAEVAGLSLSFGCGVSSSKRWAWSIFGRDAQTMETTQDNTRYQRTSAIFVSITTGNAEDSFLDLFSLDTDGFTLNQVNAPPANLFMSLALKGGSYDVGFDDKCTTASCVDTITPTATPKGVLVSSFGLAAASTVQNDAYISFGAFDSAAEGSVWTGNKDAIEPTEADRRYVTTKCVTADVTQPSTVNDEADCAISGASFTATWSSNNGGTEEWLWASFGDAVATSIKDVHMRGRIAAPR